MIKGFELPQVLEPQARNRLQWDAAVEAGFIAGLVLLVLPQGSPWSALTFFSPAIPGRPLPVSMAMSLLGVWIIHLLLSVLYGLIISRVVANLRREKAILTGGLAGLVLYVLNLGLVSFVWPALRGNEVAVALAHVVFGLVAAGAYRGLLRRKLA